MTNNNDSAFESTDSGSAFETSNASAFESHSEFGANESNSSKKHGDTFVLVDNANIPFVLCNEVELKSQGAMGRVSSAIWIDGKSEKKVLLKRRYKPVDPNAERLFSNEGLMSRLYGGGNIVKTYGNGETDEFLFMIMEFYEGQTLDTLIEQGVYQKKMNASCKLIRGLLNALVELHGAEIVHRDLKPANIMVRSNGNPVILDLGLACQVSISDVAGLSKIGTPKYAAPEQLEGSFSCASDIYSLGKIFLELYTGDLDENGIESFPKSYRSFVEKCLNENPKDRFTNAEEAKDALEAILASERSSISVVNDVDKIKVEIAKKYGDDGILDDQEMQELRSMAKMWGVAESDLSVFISSAFSNIQKFRQYFIVGCILEKSGYDKKAVMKRAKELYINPNVVEQWLEETPEKLKQIAMASAENNQKKLKLLLEKTPVNEHWMELIQDKFAPEDKKIKENSGSKRGCGVFLALLILVLAGAVSYLYFASDYFVYRGFEYETFKDPRDGESYRVIKIGDVKWMAENLRYASAESWCQNCEKMGRFYTWNAAVSACPDGWTLPTAALWEDLISTVGTANYAGQNLKASMRWEDGGNGTNTVGFAALPAGFYSMNDSTVKNQGSYARWWTYTVESLEKAIRVRIDGENSNVRLDPIGSGYGLSVRCVYVDQKKVRKLNGPQLLNAREYERITGTVERFVENGRPVVRKGKSRRLDTLDVHYGSDGVPLIFKGANVVWTRLYDKSFVKSHAETWDTLRTWVYDSLNVTGKLEVLEKSDADEGTCNVVFDGLLGNSEKVVITMNSECSKVYEGMPYQITASFKYRVGGEDYCIGCPDVMLNVEELQVNMLESDNIMVDVRNGRVYPLVKIGKQVWMAKNLYYKEDESSNIVCYENAENCEDEGYLYDYASAKSVCPAGYRLPSNSDWNELIESLGSNAVVKMKTSLYWMDGYEGTNSSGFTAIPTGYYQLSGDSEKAFFLKGEYAGWWSSTQESSEKAYVQNAIRNQPTGLSEENKTDGYSVRCIRAQ